MRFILTAEMLAPLRSGPGLIGAGIALAVFSLGGVAMGSYEPLATPAPLVKDQSRVAQTADRLPDIIWIRVASIDPVALSVRFSNEGSFERKPPLIEPLRMTPIIDAPLRGVSTTCLPAPLKAWLQKVQNACPGFRVSSALRKNARVAGSGRRSLHASCKAADFVVKDWPCAQRVLAKFPGGVSTDPTTVRCNGRLCPHIHVSYAPKGREWGARFAHSGGKKRTRLARAGKRRAA